VAVRALVIGVGLAVVAAGCGSDGDTTSASGVTATTTAPGTTTAVVTSTVAPTTTEAPPARPFTFTTSILTFEDTTRPTPEGTSTPPADSRTLETWLYLPDTADPAPLVIFSHGMAGHPRKFEELHAAWAEAGYAVAAPAFPLSNDTVQDSFGNVADVPNQDEDVVFVLDQLLAANADQSSELHQRFDPELLATGGLSAGGATTYEAAVNDVGRDPRFLAAIVMAGARFTTIDNGSFVPPVDQPVYLLHGDADPLVDIVGAQETFALLGPPTYFTTLLGGGHAGPFEDEGEGFEAKIAGMDELIHTSTIAFLDHHLLGDDAALDTLLTTADEPELTVFEAKPA